MARGQVLQSPRGTARIVLRALTKNLDGATRRKLDFIQPVKALVKAGAKRSSSYTQTASEQKRVKKTYGLHTSGRYRGHFTKRRFSGKRGSPSKKSENYFSRYGATDTLEVSGSITDPDCVYVGHSSFSAVRLFETCMVAMYRKLYIAAIGYDVSSIDQVIPYKNGNSDGHSITVFYRDSAGVMGSVFQAVPVGTSLKGLTNTAFSFSDTIWKAAINDRVIVRVTISDNDTNLVRATIDVTRLKFTYQFKSELKMQNVTIPTTEDNEADDVNNVPLVGRSYEFNNWAPRTNASNANAVGSSSGNVDFFSLVSEFDGVTLVRAAQMPQALKEPPAAAAFSNCAKSMKVRLQPGDIKSDWLIGGGSVSFQNLVNGLDFSASVPQNNRRVRIGKHAMIAVEKLIGLAGTLPIKIIYEVNHFVGVVASYGMSHGTVGTFLSVSKNNTP